VAVVEAEAWVEAVAAAAEVVEAAAAVDARCPNGPRYQST